MNTLPITEKEVNGVRYLVLDTDRTIFRYMKWSDLGDWGKRKLENFIFMSNMNEGRKYIKVGYVSAN